MNINIKTIKKIYINPDRDVKRKNDIENFFKTLGYENYERFPGVVLPKQKNCFNIGCSTSHKLAMEKYQNEIPFVLFEDDCKPTQWYDEYVNKEGILEIPGEPDIVYLGYSLAGHHGWFRASTIKDNWIILKSAMATHSILFLSKKGIDIFLKSCIDGIQRKEPLDVSYAKLMRNNHDIKVYAPKKVLFYQNNGCVMTTHVTVNPEDNKWATYHHDNNLNFEREIIYTDPNQK